MFYLSYVFYLKLFILNNITHFIANFCKTLFCSLWFDCKMLKPCGKKDDVVDCVCVLSYHWLTVLFKMTIWKHDIFFQVFISKFFKACNISLHNKDNYKLASYHFKKKCLIERNDSNPTRTNLNLFIHTFVPSIIFFSLLFIFYSFSLY